MPRPRLKHNKGLPPRWVLEHGAYFYNVKPGLEAHWGGKRKFRLGATLSEAWAEFIKRTGKLADSATIGDLLTRYAREVVAKKDIKTQKEHHRYIKQLMSVFAKSPLESVKPVDCYRYIDKREVKGQARREIKLLSHAFSMAVLWGDLERHPIKGEIRVEQEAPRTRYVEDWEIAECYSLRSPQKKGGIVMIQAYIRLKIITGLRRGDMLRLQESNITDEGISIVTGKTGQKIIIRWTDELMAAVNQARNSCHDHITPYLFCDRYGRPYFKEDNSGDPEGFKSIWRRFMDRLLKETEVKERFTEHDLRAKAGSDAESLAHAQSLLTHASSSMTKRVYRRKAERVDPVR